MKPTVGRKVWFRLNGGSNVDPSKRPVAIVKDQPMDSTIVFVRDDGLINITVADHRGEQYAFSGVPLRQDGEPMPNGIYCEWPPAPEVRQAESVLFPIDRKTAHAIVRIIQKVDEQIQISG